MRVPVMWKPWDGGILLMAPTKDVRQGEYGLVDTEYLDQLPQLEYFMGRFRQFLPQCIRNTTVGLCVPGVNLR